MATYRVLKTLPKGQQPGDSVDLNDDEARVFIAVGAVEALAVEPSAPVAPPKPRRPAKPREYDRRDMAAKDSDA